MFLSRTLDLANCIHYHNYLPVSNKIKIYQTYSYIKEMSILEPPQAFAEDWISLKF